MSARGRTPRDERRRRLGQNFVRPALAEELVAEGGVQPGELVLDIGAGDGAFTRALARRGAEVVAVEVDPFWARRLRQLGPPGKVRIVEADFLALPLPATAFRAFGSIPFGRTTDILRRLLDDPRTPLARADLIVQWEVARKRAAVPPATLLSTTWAPWWEIRLGRRIDAREFRPVPRVDAAVLIATRRASPLLPVGMAAAYADFVRSSWPFPGAG